MPRRGVSAKIHLKFIVVLALWISFGFGRFPMNPGAGLLNPGNANANIVAPLPSGSDIPYAGNPQPLPAHRLIVAGTNRTAVLAFNEETQTYSVETSTEIPGVLDAVFSAARLFLRTDDTVIGLDPDLQRKTTITYASLAALSASGRDVFVSTDDSFIALTRDLKEVGRITLDCDGYAKNAHDILTHNDMAYLLDNIVFPLFLFRVDISDPFNMQILDRIRFEDVYGHLDRQWLVPEQGQWIVLHSYVGMMGGGQIAHAYPAGSGYQSFWDQTIASYDYSTSMEGARVVGSTLLPPIWAVIEDARGYHLAKVRTDTESVIFENVVNHQAWEDTPPSSSFSVEPMGRHLFVCERQQSDLAIFDLGEASPIPILKVDLDEFGFEGVMDLLIVQGELL